MGSDDETHNVHKLAGTSHQPRHSQRATLPEEVLAVCHLCDCVANTSYLNLEGKKHDYFRRVRKVPCLGFGWQSVDAYAITEEFKMPRSDARDGILSD